MKKTPVKGTNDYLPNQTALRNYIENSILFSYKNFGYERITTPILEDAENLDKSDGGENLNLIFYILKRGEKLASALKNGSQKDISDMGLRYDLTLPLSRFYANNKEKLVFPFKCIQIDKVYRAERPQKGRLRELIQCDIDIIGSNSIYCEIELIDATAKALLKLGLKNFKIKVNDRRILNDIISQSGFDSSDIPSICMTFDKYDKIGIDGIIKELISKEFPEDSVKHFSDFLKSLPITLDTIKNYCKNDQAIDDLIKIIGISSDLSKNEYEVEFDLSLVRGQGYYTGPVFEIKSKDFNSSIGGGGRYDGLIGKFIGENIPAVGFSIGFERIYCMLSESNYSIPDNRKKIAVIYNRNDFISATATANQLRLMYDVSLFEETKKLSKLISSLENSGYYGFINLSTSKELRTFL